MKQYIFFIFLFITIPVISSEKNNPSPSLNFSITKADYADHSDLSHKKQGKKSNINLEFLPVVKISGFIPTNSPYKRIYGSAPFYTLEASLKIYKNIAPFLNVGFLYNPGHIITTTSNKPFTDLYMVPIGFGLKYYFSLKNMEPYLGIGILANYTYIHNTPSNFSSKNNWSVGGLFKLGTLVDITSMMFLDFFVDYYYINPNFSNSSPFVNSYKGNLSGFSLGGGLGGRF